MIAVALLFALRIHAALIEFDSKGKETDTGARTQDTFNFQGLVIYDTVSSNVTFIEWRTDNKTYHSFTSTNLNYTAVTGPGSQSNLVISRASSVTDTNGYFHLDAYVLTGVVDTLHIARDLNVRFPKNLDGASNHSLDPDNSGNEWLAAWTESLKFDQKLTNNDNDAGLTGAQVASAFIVGLQQQGYTGD